mgnify:CR=1 FL=1
MKKTCNELKNCFENQGRGLCVQMPGKNAECRCTPGNAGSMCERPKCQVDEFFNIHTDQCAPCTTCKAGVNSGTCDGSTISDNVCNTPKPTCTTAEDCNGHGKAMGDKPNCTCACEPGYMGSGCEGDMCQEGEFLAESNKCVPCSYTKANCNYAEGGYPTACYNDFRGLEESGVGKYTGDNKCLPTNVWCDQPGGSGRCTSSWDSMDDRYYPGYNNHGDAMNNIIDCDDLWYDSTRGFRTDWNDFTFDEIVPVHNNYKQYNSMHFDEGLTEIVPVSTAGWNTWVKKCVGYDYKYRD